MQKEKTPGLLQLYKLAHICKRLLWLLCNLEMTGIKKLLTHAQNNDFKPSTTSEKLSSF